MYQSALNGTRYLPGGPEEGFPEETFQLDLGGGLVWRGVGKRREKTLYLRRVEPQIKAKGTEGPLMFEK